MTRADLNPGINCSCFSIGITSVVLLVLTGLCSAVRTALNYLFNLCMTPFKMKHNNTLRCEQRYYLNHFAVNTKLNLELKMPIAGNYS